ncbi:MAG: decarboxylating 6-phosphogluconate dehydrogenase [Chloroflexota bacterium]
MKIGFVGLGRMGFNMVTRLSRGGHQVVAFDRDSAKVDEIAQLPGVSAATSVDDMLGQLVAPRAVWVMVPSGDPTEQTIKMLASRMGPGDTIVDGGNSYVRDSIRRGRELGAMGIDFVDQGTSGGVWGLQNGYCLMIGGEKQVFDRLEPIFAALAPADGYLHTGAIGSGHFVKMVHNGIEYGMMQAFGEGFEVMQASQFDLDLRAISHLWNQGSVVRSWLCELAELAFAADAKLESIAGYVEDSGEGRWTIQEALNENVPAPVITLSLLERLRSRQRESFSAKVIAALRNQFGGHAVKAAAS